MGNKSIIFKITVLILMAPICLPFWVFIWIGNACYVLGRLVSYLGSELTSIAHKALIKYVSKPITESLLGLKVK